MAGDRFGLSDLRFYAHHGAAEHEQTVGQWFSVDIELTLDLAEAASTDRLDAAVDYRDVAGVALGAATGWSAALIEAVAARVADALLEKFPAERARVRLRKSNPPAPGVAGTTWVEIIRDRRRAA